MSSDQFERKKVTFHELDKQLAVTRTELASKTKALKSASTQVDRLEAQMIKLREDYEVQLNRVTKDYYESARQVAGMKVELKLIKSGTKKNKLKSIFLGIAASFAIFSSTIVGGIGVNLITQKSPDANGWLFVCLAGVIFLSATVYTALK